MIRLLVLIWNRYLNCKIKSRIQLKDFLSAEFDFFSLALFPPLFEPFSLLRVRRFARTASR